jgi:Alpha/beta hydrolase domain
MPILTCIDVSGRLGRTTPLVAAVAAIVATIGGTPASAAVPANRWTPASSRITSVTVTINQPVGTFNGAAYVRLAGTVNGVVGPDEPVVGLADVPKDADGNYPYSAQFELITAAPGQPRSDGVLVEAENRGSPFVFDSIQNLGLLQGPPATIAYPVGLGNGFLQASGLAWARVQWQGANGAAPVINATVPATAQGVGEVIVRDFGLLLRGSGVDGLPRYDTAVLVGVSQSAWFVNTFIAEGFNAPPSGHGLIGRPRRVFEGAYTQDGVGNWLALNQVNAAEGFTTQSPYVQRDGVPLTPTRLLRRPLTDPFLVDTTAYTDFYRVRASLFNTARQPWNLREYNLPNAHSSAATLPPNTSPARVACAPGVTDVVALNPLDGRPFTRALVLALARRVGVRHLRTNAPALPPSNRFALTDGPVPPALDGPLPLFNFLPGHDLKVPTVNADNQPTGGVVHYPDVELSLGVPAPVAVPPVGTTAITDTCGNFGGWKPFTAAELQARYGSVEQYLAAYTPLLDRLIDTGRVLPSDRPGILAFVTTLYNAAPRSTAHVAITMFSTCSGCPDTSRT